MSKKSKGKEDRHEATTRQPSEEDAESSDVDEEPASSTNHSELVETQDAPEQTQTADTARDEL